MRWLRDHEEDIRTIMAVCSMGIQLTALYFTVHIYHYYIALH